MVNVPVLYIDRILLHVLSFSLRDNSVSFHECSPIWVAIFINVQWKLLYFQLQAIGKPNMMFTFTQSTATRILSYTLSMASKKTLILDSYYSNIMEIRTSYGILIKIANIRHNDIIQSIKLRFVVYILDSSSEIVISMQCFNMFNLSYVVFDIVNIDCHLALVY